MTELLLEMIPLEVVTAFAGSTFMVVGLGGDLFDFFSFVLLSFSILFFTWKEHSCQRRLYIHVRDILCMGNGAFISGIGYANGKKRNNNLWQSHDKEFIAEATSRKGGEKIDLLRCKQYHLVDPYWL